MGSYLTGEANAANQERLAQRKTGGTFGWGSSGENAAQKSARYMADANKQREIAASGGMGSGGYNSLIAQMKKEASERNKRFEIILKRQREMREKMMNKARSSIEGAGTARRQEIQETGVQRGASGAQSLISKGLGNTTITSAVQRGVDADTDRSMTYQKSQEAGQISSLYSQEAGMSLGEGQFQLGGERGMGGGLSDYIKMLTSLGGGLS